MTSWKRRWLNRPGQLVGDRLALDRVVQVRVLDRDARLAGEIAEQLALAGGELLVGAGDREHAEDAAAVLRAQRVRERVGVAELGLDGRPGVQRRRLGRADDVAVAVDVALPGDLLEAPVVLGPQRRAAGVGADPVDRRLHRDLEQRAALERLAERLADALDRRAQALALDLELLEPPLELAGHLVELDAERGELVAALGRDLDAEVALRHLLRGRQQPLDLGLQGARDGDRERERGDQRGDQDREHLDRLLAQPAVLGLGQEPHGHAAAVEARAVEAHQPPRGAGDLDLAARGQLLGAARRAGSWRSSRRARR